MGVAWEDKQLVFGPLAIGLNRLRESKKQSALEDEIVDEFSSKKNGECNQRDSNYVLPMVT